MSLDDEPSRTKPAIPIRFNSDRANPWITMSALPVRSHIGSNLTPS
jgi:hypothetical protein